MGRGAWRAAAHGVAKGWTQLSDYHFRNSNVSDAINFQMSIS